jgi:hypothetical protein
MTQWYSHIWELGILKKGSWVQTHCCAKDIPSDSLPLSLTWGCQQLKGEIYYFSIQKKEKSVAQL